MPEEKQQLIHTAAQAVSKAVPDIAFWPTSIGTLWASLIGVIPELTVLVVFIVAVLKGIATWEDILYKRWKRLNKD